MNGEREANEYLIRPVGNTSDIKYKKENHNRTWAD